MDVFLVIIAVLLMTVIENHSRQTRLSSSKTPAKPTYR